MDNLVSWIVIDSASENNKLCLILTMTSDIEFIVYQKAALSVIKQLIAKMKSSQSMLTAADKKPSTFCNQFIELAHLLSECWELKQETKLFVFIHS